MINCALQSKIYSSSVRAIHFEGKSYSEIISPILRKYSANNLFILRISLILSQNIAL